MVLLFLRDWRSVVVVVLNIPLALAAAACALWASGQTLNLMTLGGLALAVGILVDEATVEVENIHTQLLKYDNVARAVRQGNSETAVPRLLAMLCILAVFIPSFFMEGAARELFVPLSLAVGYAMIASYLLSSTFVPVLCVWLLKPGSGHAEAKGGLFGKLMDGYEAAVARIVYRKYLVVPLYLAAALALAALLYFQLGTSIFPPTDKGAIPAPAEGADRHPHRANGGTRTGSHAAHQGGSRRGERGRHRRLHRHVPHQLSDPGHSPVDERAGRVPLEGRAQRELRAARRGAEGEASHEARRRAEGVARGAVEGGRPHARGDQTSGYPACGCRSNRATSSAT